jgi:hypothetical protein
MEGQKLWLQSQKEYSHAVGVPEYKKIYRLLLKPGNVLDLPDGTYRSGMYKCKCVAVKGSTDEDCSFVMKFYSDYCQDRNKLPEYDFFCQPWTFDDPMEQSDFKIKDDGRMVFFEGLMELSDEFYVFQKDNDKYELASQAPENFKKISSDRKYGWPQLHERYKKDVEPIRSAYLKRKREEAPPPPPPKKVKTPDDNLLEIFPYAFSDTYLSWFWHKWCSDGIDVVMHQYRCDKESEYNEDNDFVKKNHLNERPDEIMENLYGRNGGSVKITPTRDAFTIQTKVCKRRTTCCKCHKYMQPKTKRVELHYKAWGDEPWIHKFIAGTEYFKAVAYVCPECFYK